MCNRYLEAKTYWQGRDAGQVFKALPGRQQGILLDLARSGRLRPATCLHSGRSLNHQAMLQGHWLDRASFSNFVHHIAAYPEKCLLCGSPITPDHRVDVAEYLQEHMCPSCRPAFMLALGVVFGLVPALRPRPRHAARTVTSVTVTKQVIQQVVIRRTSRRGPGGGR